MNYMSGNPALDVGQTREFVDDLIDFGPPLARVIFLTLSWEPARFNVRRMRVLILWAEDGNDPDCYHPLGSTVVLHEDVAFFACSAPF